MGKKKGWGWENCRCGFRRGTSIYASEKQSKQDKEERGKDGSKCKAASSGQKRVKKLRRVPKKKALDASQVCGTY